MEIESTEQFKVGSRVFKTKEEAENHIAILKKRDEILKRNINLLESSNLKYIPVIDDDEYTIFYPTRDDWNRPTWEGLGGSELKYIYDELKIITPKEYIDHLTNNIIRGEDYHIFIKAILEWFKDDNSLFTTEEILNKLKEIQIYPEQNFIYD